MFARSSPRTCRAALGLALLLSVFLPTLSARAAAQRPEPPVPETTPAMPQNYANPVDAVKAADRQRFAAMVQGDTTLLERLLGDDLTYTHTTGAVDTKATFLAALKSGKLRYLAITPAEVQVRVYGNAAAVVTGRVDLKVAADGKEAAFPARFTSVYAERDGRWRLVAWQSTRLPQP